MVTNSFGNKSSMQPMKGSAWTQEGSSSFLFGKERVGEVFLSFSLSPVMFLMYSHKVPQVVPNITSLLSHMLCPKFNSQVYKTEKVSHREHHICFYFATGSPKRLFYWGLPKVPKQLVMGQSIWPLQKV